MQVSVFLNEVTKNVSFLKGIMRTCSIYAIKAALLGIQVIRKIKAFAAIAC